jgi:hypothetical protein
MTHAMIRSALLLLAAGVVSAHAQLDVSVRVDPARAVLHEPVIAHVRIRNQTAHEIELGAAESTDRFWMEIEREPGSLVASRDTPLLSAALVVPAGGTVTHRVNLPRHYDLRATGPYTVRAGVSWRGRGFLSSGVYLDLVPGLEMMRAAGPGPDGSGMRLYRLLTLNRDRGEHLFLRIDDEEGRMSYGTIHLGRLLRLNPPQLIVDAHGHITILHQTAPGRYAYHRFSPDGRALLQRVYTSERHGVALELGEDGHYRVTGASASLHDTQ